MPGGSINMQCRNSTEGQNGGSGVVSQNQRVTWDYGVLLEVSRLGQLRFTISAIFRKQGAPQNRKNFPKKVFLSSLSDFWGQVWACGVSLEASLPGQIRFTTFDNFCNQGAPQNRKNYPKKVFLSSLSHFWGQIQACGVSLKASWPGQIRFTFFENFRNQGAPKYQKKVVFFVKEKLIRGLNPD